jgi:hypothetical protein
MDPESTRVAVDPSDLIHVSVARIVRGRGRKYPARVSVPAYSSDPPDEETVVVYVLNEALTLSEYKTVTTVFAN